MNWRWLLIIPAVALALGTLVILMGLLAIDQHDVPLRWIGTRIG